MSSTGHIENSCAAAAPVSLCLAPCVSSYATFHTQLTYSMHRERISLAQPSRHRPKSRASTACRLLCSRYGMSSRSCPRSASNTFTRDCRVYKSRNKLYTEADSQVSADRQWLLMPLQKTIQGWGPGCLLDADTWHEMFQSTFVLRTDLQSLRPPSSITVPPIVYPQYPTAPAQMSFTLSPLLPPTLPPQGLRVYHDELIVGDVRLVMLVPSWFPKAHVQFDWQRVQGDRVSVVFVLRGTMQDLVGNTKANLQLIYNKLVSQSWPQQPNQAPNSRNAFVSVGRCWCDASSVRRGGQAAWQGMELWGQSCGNRTLLQQRGRVCTSINSSAI